MREMEPGRGEEMEGTPGYVSSTSPRCVPKHSLSVESIVSAVPSRGMRTSKRASNSSNRLTSNSDTQAQYERGKFHSYFASPFTAGMEDERGEELLFLLRSLQAY